MPERNCATCTARQKLTWGCDDAPRDKLEIDGFLLARCPKRPILDDPVGFSDLFWHYGQMQKGYLPEKGGLNDQPAKFMQYMRIIDRALDYCRSEQDRREEAKRRGSGPRFGK